MITQKVLKELLYYDPDTGVFTWKERSRKWFKNNAQFKNWNGRYPNRPAGSENKGYVVIGLLGKKYNAHRLAWLYVVGELPLFEILHNDHNDINNIFTNLTDDVHSTNMKNRKQNRNNKSGWTGICWYESFQKWRSQIRVNGKLITLGYFINLNDAINVRKKANIKYGFPENNGANNGC